MKVEDVMTKDVQTCRPETNLADAAMRMWRNDCGILPVVADGEKVVGVITDRDICMAGATRHRDQANIRVEEVISGKVYGCPPNVDIHEALKIMRKNQVRRLPIIRAEDGKLVGFFRSMTSRCRSRAAPALSYRLKTWNRRCGLSVHIALFRSPSSLHRRSRK